MEVKIQDHWSIPPPVTRLINDNYKSFFGEYASWSLLELIFQQSEHV